MHLDVPDDKALIDEDLETVRLELLDFVEREQRDVVRSTGPKDRDLELVRAGWTVRLCPQVDR